MSDENFDPSGGIIHLAGPTLRVANVVRVRCSWCGALIDEHDLDRISWHSDDDNPFVHDDGTPRNRLRGLVWLSEGNPTVRASLPDPDNGRIPSGSCMDLASEITR